VFAVDINQLFPCEPSATSGTGGPECSIAQVSSGPTTETLNFSFYMPGRPDDPGPDLNLLTGRPLTDEGGTVPLSLTAGTFSCCSFNVSSKLIAGALIGTPMPEPSEALLVALGLAALVGSPAWRALLPSQRRTTQ
jgi:hypothetical protein